MKEILHSPVFVGGFVAIAFAGLLLAERYFEYDVKRRLAPVVIETCLETPVAERAPECEDILEGVAP